MALKRGDLRRRALQNADTGAGQTAAGALHTIMLPDPSYAREPEAIAIRLADCDGHRNRANMLLNRMYSWRGYGSNHKLPAAPNCMSFTATAGDDVIGTLTLTVDSRAGLAIDATFAAEIAEFRAAPGAKLCELTKFAFDTSSPSRPRLAALFHIVFIYGSMHHACTDLFIEVNPRHRRYYEVMLGFRPVGTSRTNEAVGAPSQLMWLNVADIRRYVDKMAGTNCDQGRSLYPYFFSAHEEQHIYGRLAGRSGQGVTSPAGVHRPQFTTPPQWQARSSDDRKSVRTAKPAKPRWQLLKAPGRGRGYADDITAYLNGKMQTNSSQPLAI